MVPSNIKKIINNCLSKFGLELKKRAELQANPFIHQLELIGGLNKKDVTIFDIGAHIGMVTEKYLKIFPNALVHSFEPFPNSIFTLHEKFDNEKRVKIVEKAVASDSGEKSFFVNNLDATNSLLPRPFSGRRYYPKIASPEKIIKVKTISLDEYVKAEGINGIDILKFDIQGGEMEALKGASNLLRTINPSVIYIEIMFIPHYENCALFYKIWSHLVKFNYSLFGIYDLHIARNNQIRYGDALFINHSLRQNINGSCHEEP